MRCERRVPSEIRRRAKALGVAGATSILFASCASPGTRGSRMAMDEVGNTAIRVLLADHLGAADLGATGSWMLLDDQRRLLARAAGNQAWRIERNGTSVRSEEQTSE